MPGPASTTRGGSSFPDIGTTIGNIFKCVILSAVGVGTAGCLIGGIGCTVGGYYASGTASTVLKAIGFTLLGLGAASTTGMGIYGCVMCCKAKKVHDTAQAVLP